MYIDVCLNPSNTEKGKRREPKNENVKEGVNLFKVHYMHAWNYHNETSYLSMLIQK
jgi:hypothetical protein